MSARVASNIPHSIDHFSHNSNEDSLSDGISMSPSLTQKSRMLSSPKKEWTTLQGSFLSKCLRGESSAQTITSPVAFDDLGMLL
jgi:hypothetical protein